MKQSPKRSPNRTALLLTLTSFTLTLGSALHSHALQSSTPQEDDGVANGTVIYGDDNRKDLYQVTDPTLKKLSESTVALIAWADLKAVSGNKYQIKAIKYGVEYDLCKTEPYFHQNLAAFCSGFLVAPDTLVTAGHCISDEKTCADTAFVFGYAYKTATSAPTHAANADVYKCKEIVHSEQVGGGADFAVIKLDRAVTNRPSLKFRMNGEINRGDSLVVIGHPGGLPTKIADGATVRDATPAGYFVANLDTYGGNSGSAVFNAKTHEVEGLLVRGEQDFEWTPNRCSVSKRCKNDECRGEDVTRISEALPYLSTRQR